MPCATPFVPSETVLLDGASSKVYVYTNIAVTYTVASSACQALGSSSGYPATLVCYGSYAENYLVESYFRRSGVLPQGYWMGLRQPTLGSGAW
jgi:hypothetical protein